MTIDRERPREVSEEEVAQLGNSFNLDVPEGELNHITNRVNKLLDGIVGLSEMPVDSREYSGPRSWQQPRDNPHNVIVTECDVAPTDSHSGELEGMTVGLKDVIAVADIPMSCGSQVMTNFVPHRDAVVVDRLRHAGARITAKLNLGEFAATLLSMRLHPVTNPYDDTRVAGGSSSGSAAAVALDIVDSAIGTDTGGSIRIPAAWCGVVGLKPTHGLVPQRGVVENTYTQDHVGPLTNTVEDAARVLEVIAGKDYHDPASMQASGHDDYAAGGYTEAVENPPEARELAIGVVSNAFDNEVDSSIVDRTWGTLDRIEDAGASVREVSVDYFSKAKPIKNLLSFTELATHWRAGGAPFRRGGIVDEAYQEQFALRTKAANDALGEFYKCKLLAGAYIASYDHGRLYTRAQAAREVVHDEFDQLLSDFDVLAMPTATQKPPLLEDVWNHKFPFDVIRNTRHADVTKMPAITLPNGFVEGLPTGFQLMAPRFEEATLLGIAHRFEEHTGT